MTKRPAVSMLQSVVIGPFRHSRLVGDLVACGEQQTLIGTSAEWLGSE
jgi:hypothetical protein